MDNKVIPVLQIYDYSEAKEFYIDWLGFVIDWERALVPGSPLYIQISRDHITLHLSEHHEDSSPGAKVFIEFQNIAAFHHDLISKNYKFSKPGLEKSPWNAVCMEVIDPFGNKLLFSERQHE